MSTEYQVRNSQKPLSISKTVTCVSLKLFFDTVGFNLTWHSTQIVFQEI
jgi:hypothetical protein